MDFHNLPFRSFFPHMLIWIIFGLATCEDQFEAAFQGQCDRAETPCQHICRNHSPRTFECFCHHGFQLEHNGYACSPVLPLDTRPTNRSNLESPSPSDQPTNLPYPTVNVQSNQTKVHQSPCKALLCQGGGVCASDKLHGYRCLCPLGRKGTHCQETVALTTPRFSGDSHALLPLATDWDFEFHLEMEIRAENENGLLLYSGENLSASKDFLVLELLDSYVVYRLQMGRTTISIQSRYKVPLGDTVMIRAGRSIVDLYLRVASEDQIVTTVQDIAEMNLKATENIFVGGMPDFDGLNTGLIASRTGFVGCVLTLKINGKMFPLEPLPFGTIIHGINLDRCETHACHNVNCLNDGQCVMDLYNKPKCDCAVTFVGQRCEIDMQLQIPLFNGTSYLIFPVSSSTILHVTSLLITFKPTNVTDGVLVQLGRPNHTFFSDAFQLRLRQGFLEFSYDLGEGITVLRIRSKLLIDQWYQVALKRTGRFAELILDSKEKSETIYAGEFSQLNVEEDLLYIGGVDYGETADLNPSFRGCIDLNKSEFMGNKLTLSKALTGSNLDTCRSA